MQAIGKKQQTTQDEWLRSIEAIRRGEFDFAALDRLIEKTVDAMREIAGAGNVAFAWSGGKDSIVLEWLCRQAGISECVLGMCDLEYPAFLQWITANMPDGLEVINTGLDIEWLALNPEMLFPETANIAARWFKLVQHTAQEKYIRQRRVGALIVGRRRADGNFISRDGSLSYTTSKGFTRASPIADWTHEDVLALIEREALPIPPIYDWPRGYQVGTHAWPARQWTGGIENGWREVYSIDPAIVRDAARLIPSAARFLESV